MKPVLVNIDMLAPAARVWRICTDIANAAETIPMITRIEFLGEVRHGLGTRWRETRIMFGREAVEELEITEWRPPEEYVVSARHHGHDYRAVVRVVARGEATRLEYEFSATPRSFGARILGAILGPLTKGMLVKALTEELEAIKRRCEAGD